MRGEPRALKSNRGREAQQRGRLVEALCLLRLWLTGWRIVAHRLTGKRGSGLGEIDVIARRGSVLAFIEVKARASRHEALDAITGAQRARIQSAAAAYLAAHPHLAHYNVRFDAMIVGENTWPEHVPDAWRLY